VLSRGKLHIALLPENFPGEDPDGATMLVEAVRTAVNIRFQTDSRPLYLFTDRGRGFYEPSTSLITPEYAAAVNTHKFKTMMGDCASSQPGNLADILLHETAVAWIRVQLKNTRPLDDWKETRDEYADRLRKAAAHINEHYDVAGLNNELVDRLREVVHRYGDRLSK